jgi:hypothetical protein
LIIKLCVLNGVVIARLARSILNAVSKSATALASFSLVKDSFFWSSLESLRSMNVILGYSFLATLVVCLISVKLVMRWKSVLCAAD